MKRNLWRSRNGSLLTIVGGWTICPQVNKHASVSLNWYTEFILLSHLDSEEMTFYIVYFSSTCTLKCHECHKIGYISALVCRCRTSINHNWDTGNATPRLSPWTITLQPYTVIKINNLEVPYGCDFKQLQHSRWVESVRWNKAFKWWIRSENLFIFWFSLGLLVLSDKKNVATHLKAVVFKTRHLSPTERKYSEFMHKACGLRSTKTSLLRRRHERDGSCRWSAPTCLHHLSGSNISITGSPAPTSLL